MAAKESIGKASAAARAAQSNQYVKRIIEDEELRGSLLAAYLAARSAYGRMSNGKPATKALFEDRKLQRELAEAVGALRDASIALKEPPKRRAPARRLWPHVDARARRGRARARAQRKSALEGARPAVRGRGGVRLQLDHDAGAGGAELGGRTRLLRPTTPHRRRWLHLRTMASAVESGSRGRGARPLSGERAQRIVEAMRRSVAQHGTAGSTFERVAREAGVSRGLLHYYFGTKEQLLAEAVRRDCQLRLERLEQQLAGAQTAEDFIGLMAQHLQDMIREDPDFVTLLFELFTLSRRNDEIATEYANLMRTMREQVAGMLTVAQDEGVLRLHADPEAIAEILFSLGDGFALRMLTEPDRDFTATIRAGIVSARALLAD